MFVVLARSPLHRAIEAILSLALRLVVLRLAAEDVVASAASEPAMIGVRVLLEMRLASCARNEGRGHSGHDGLELVDVLGHVASCAGEQFCFLQAFQTFWLTRSLVLEGKCV